MYRNREMTFIYLLFIRVGLQLKSSQNISSLLNVNRQLGILTLTLTYPNIVYELYIL